MMGSGSWVVLRYIPLAAYVVTILGVSAKAGGFDPWTGTATYELEHRVDLGEWESAKPGSVRVWLPMPADNGRQRVRLKAIESPWPYRETLDANGNRFVYLEPSAGQAVGGEIVMRFTVERSPHTGISRSDVKPDTPLDPARYLSPLSRIPLTGKVREYAEQAGAGLRTDAKRIRAYYDFVIATMSYGKYGEGWGRGDAVWACNAKYGNCTDFHSVIIGMCRSQGIPARFVIGFSLPRDRTEMRITGYHCWAEAYDRDSGWLPMDASDAWKAKRFDDYYGRLPCDRVEYVVGRDLVLDPPQSGPPLNFLIYPYVEIDGKPVGSVPWTLRARRIETYGGGRKH